MDSPSRPPTLCHLHRPSNWQTFPRGFGSVCGENPSQDTRTSRATEHGKTLGPLAPCPQRLQHLLYGRGSRKGGRPPEIPQPHDRTQQPGSTLQKHRFRILTGSQVGMPRSSKGPRSCWRKPGAVLGLQLLPQLWSTEPWSRNPTSKPLGCTSQGPIPMKPGDAPSHHPPIGTIQGAISVHQAWH